MTELPNFIKYRSKFYCGNEDVQKLAKFAEEQYKMNCMAIKFIHDIATNWDCDTDSHKYGNPCRKCEANDILVRGFYAIADSVDKQWNEDTE